MTAKVRYQCTLCGGYGHRRNHCPNYSDGGKDGPRVRAKPDFTRVNDDAWHFEQQVIREKIQRECDTILRLEELVGHKTLEAESEVAGQEYDRYGVADVDEDDVKPVRATKEAEAVILKAMRGEI